MPRHAHVSSQLAPATGPFSHAVQAGDLLFLSGQIGQEPATSTLVPGGAPEQARQIFRNLRVVLEDLGLDFGDVVKVSVFLADMADFPAVNDVYSEHFEKPYPARTTVAVRELPMRAMIEIDLVARTR